MHSVYVLRSLKDGDLYVGSSGDVKQRLSQHNEGKVASTSHRRPFRLIYCEMYANRTDAMHRELYLKTGWGRTYLRKVLKHTLAKSGSKI